MGILGYMQYKEAKRRQRTTKIGSLAAAWGSALVPFKTPWTKLWRLTTGASKVPSGLSNPSKAFLRQRISKVLPSRESASLKEMLLWSKTTKRESKNWPEAKTWIPKERRLIEVLKWETVPNIFCGWQPIATIAERVPPKRALSGSIAQRHQTVIVIQTYVKNRVTWSN